MKDKLNDAVVLERRQRNDFTSSSNNNPENGRLKYGHDNELKGYYYFNYSDYANYRSFL